MAELVHSIREVGLLQPVVVRRPATDAYELVMGERRWRAAQAAGLDHDPGDRPRDRRRPTCCATRCWRTCTAPSSTRWRRPRPTQQLLEDFGCTHEELAERIGRSRPQISNTIRLLKLSPGRPAPGRRRRAVGRPRPVPARRRGPRAPGPAGPAGGRRGHQRARASRRSSRSATTDEPAPRRVPQRSPSRPAWPSSPTGSRTGSRPGSRSTWAGAKGRITVEFASLDDLRRIVDIMDPRNRDDRPI